MTLEEIHAAMHRYNRKVAPGSECHAWQDFVADSYSTFGFAPFDDRAAETSVPLGWGEYWLDVASGSLPSGSNPFEPETGMRVEQ